uniref:Uncharacterized protein n=1 Tax=Parascaris univalens TaxID=6257 RepID=A0A915BA97_PARUN
SFHLYLLRATSKRAHAVSFLVGRISHEAVSYQCFNNNCGAVTISCLTNMIRRATKLCWQVDGDEFVMVEAWSVSFEASAVLFRVKAVSVINSSMDLMKIHN